MKFTRVVLSVLLFVAARAEDAALPVEIAPNDRAIQYMGRFDTRDAKGPRCEWPACTVSLKFKGTAINAKLSDGGKNRVQFIVDGKPAKVLAPKGAGAVYSLAGDLPDGEHTVAIMKRTEASQGALQFLGFQLSAGGKALEQPPAKRRIEVIGDSISCGYGNEGKDQNEHFKPETENAYMTYGAL